MAEVPSREELIRQGDELWAALWAKLGVLSDEQLEQPGASGPQWSGKNVLGHIAHWHDHAAEVIRDIVEGREPDSRSNYDEWNARWFDEDAALTSAEVREYCERSRGALRSYLLGLSEQQWAESTWDAPDGSTWHIHGTADVNMNEHYREHLDELAESGWSPAG
ncbi:MAG TPA: maleylpyruvate isomerase N-terminal domain-containing protein [Dehalococcoidia bacterium]|nr:maleylpyruvate isomerase N-terminal domain-containing protein [Dehalococcoidia bacterium]